MMAEQEKNEPVFSTQRVYLKDASLEMPNAPQIFLENDAPQIDIRLEQSEAVLGEGFFEVTVTTTVTAKVKEQVAYLIEAKQGGIFNVANFPAEQVQQILGIVCPNIIYPYLRSNIADLLQRTGYPSFHIPEVNFEAIYEQRKAAQDQEPQAAANE
jgi:preprotein translocase subunit SecB